MKIFINFDNFKKNKEKNMSEPNSKLPNLTTQPEEFVLKIEEQNGNPLYKLTPQQARDFLEDLQAQTYEEIPAEVKDLTIYTDVAGDVKIRTVRPAGNNDILPAIIYIHGGGWVIGSKNSFDMLIRKIAIHTNSVVIFPEYSLSPEARFPKALEEIYAVLKYIYEEHKEFNIDKKRIAIAGDSAGGNMATATAIKAKNDGDIKLVFECLFYPVTNADMDTHSYDQFRDGPWLSKKAMEWFWDAYAPDKSIRDDLYISPLQAEETQLAGLPKTLIITAENDVLRDEGEAFARKLDSAGVDVLNVRINGTIHDFLMLNALSNTEPAKGALILACKMLKKSLHK